MEFRITRATSELCENSFCSVFCSHFLLDWKCQNISPCTYFCCYSSSALVCLGSSLTNKSRFYIRQTKTEEIRTNNVTLFGSGCNYYNFQYVSGSLFRAQCVFARSHLECVRFTHLYLSILGFAYSESCFREHGNPIS